MSYEVLRLAPGQVTAYTLLNTDSYVIADWTRTSDMSSSDYWSATMPEYGMRAAFTGGVEIGSGQVTSPYSGTIEFFMLTEAMQQYIETNIMINKPIAPVTAYCYDDRTRALAAFYGELVSPFFVNAETTYSPFGHTIFTNNQYLFRGATKVTVSYLLLEAGDYLLLETGDKLALESQS